MKEFVIYGIIFIIMILLGEFIMLYCTNKNNNESLPIYIDKENILSSDNYSMFRIVVIESGSGILDINNHSIIITSPSLLCLSEKDTIELVNECNIEGHVVYFDPSIINSSFALDNIYDMNDFDSITSSQDYFYLAPFITRSENFYGYFEIGLAVLKKILELFKSLYNEITLYENKFWACRSRSFFLEILFLIQYMATDYDETNTIELPNTSADLNEIILYLHTNYQTKITIDMLTKKFLINRTTLSQKFHDSMGMSIKDYLIKLRIKVSAIMLRDTFLPITEIIYRVGFSEANHFGRMFKKYMGCTPSQYRKNLNS